MKLIEEIFASRYAEFSLAKEWMKKLLERFLQ